MEPNQTVTPTSTSVVENQTTVPQIQYAGFWTRVGASGLDTIFTGIIIIVLVIIILIVGGSQTPQSVLQVIGSLASLLYYIYFTGKTGQTWGKKLLKIKVVRMNGENQEAPGYFRAFIRESIGKFISEIVFGLGYFWMIWDSKKQTWHDKMAGTVVVKI